MAMKVEDMGGHEKFCAKVVKDNAKFISVRMQTLIRKSGSLAKARWDEIIKAAGDVVDSSTSARLLEETLVKCRGAFEWVSVARYTEAASNLGKFDEYTCDIAEKLASAVISARVMPAASGAKALDEAADLLQEISSYAMECVKVVAAGLDTSLTAQMTADSMAKVTSNGTGSFRVLLKLYCTCAGTSRSETANIKGSSTVIKLVSSQLDAICKLGLATQACTVASAKVMLETKLAQKEGVEEYNKASKSFSTGAPTNVWEVPVRGPRCNGMRKLRAVFVFSTCPVV
jgi:hypothetical protein